MADFTKLCLYDKTIKTIPRQGYKLLILHIQYWLLEDGLHCFAEACRIINFELMAADSQRRAQCILVKNGPLTPALTM